MRTKRNTIHCCALETQKRNLIKGELNNKWESFTGSSSSLISKVIFVFCFTISSSQIYDVEETRIYVTAWSLTKCVLAAHTQIFKFHNKRTNNLPVPSWLICVLTIAICFFMETTKRMRNKLMSLVCLFKFLLKNRRLI